MNIRKFLNKIILVSAAIFWAGCSNDSVTKAASDNEDATANPDTPTTDSGSSTVGNKSSSSSHVKSSSSSSSNYFNCRSIDHIWPIDYRDESYKKDPKEDAEKKADYNAQISIHDSVMQRIFHEDNVFYADIYPRTTTFCLFKMADTLEQIGAPVYGTFSTEGSITKSVYCPDGTTHLTDEYLSYEEDLKAHEEDVKAYEEQKAAYKEAYDKYYEEYYSKRAAELMTLLDSCVNHPDDFKPANDDEQEEYCSTLDSLEFYPCNFHLEKDEEDGEEKNNNEEEEMSSSSKASSSSEKTAEAKSSSSSKKNNEGDFHGEFAKKSIL
ncbi:MAG: hypothetical protein J5615_07390 [Fibrobacter sp.]|nr:hypothetical protein [Fibrobacter sp.]